MRSVVVAVVLVSACGSASGPGPSGPPTKPIVRNDGPPAEPDPHASRDALVKRTFVAIAAGDTPKLVELVDVKNVMTRATRCDADADEKRFDPVKEMERVQRRMRELTEDTKGLTLEVLEITDEAHGIVLPKGRIGNCEILADLAQVHIRVKVRVAKAGFPTQEKVVKVGLLTLENRWYLDRVSNNLAPVEESKVDYVATTKDHADRMCACKDKACGDKINEDHRRWLERVGSDKMATPSTDEVRRFTEATKLYVDCFTKTQTMP